MVVRERLLELLRERWFAPVTVVSAPAGYGKTTLLDQAVSANTVAPVGIDVRVACGPATSASTLADSLCRALGGPAVTGRSDATGFARAVVDAVWHRSPVPVAITCDDVHELSPDAEATRMLDAIVASLPANGHVVLVGRSAQPLRVARFELDDRIVRIGAGDLAFNEDEVAAFAALRGVPLAQVQGCEGWPAFAELSATDLGAVGAYVGEEVLSNLPTGRRRRLAVLAQLGRFDARLAGAVLGPDTDVAEELDGLPLVSELEDGTWRMHALWASLLAAEITPAEAARARGQAGHELLQQGHADAAAGLLLDAGEWDAFTDAIAEALGVAHPPVGRDVLAGWFARLPAPIRTTPAGRLLAGVLSVDADADGARRTLSECATAFRRIGHTAGEVACLVQLGQLAWWAEDPDALAVVASRIFELEAEGHAAVEPLACLARALLYDIANDSRSMLAELDRILPGTLSDAWQGIVSWARAIGLLELGLLAEAFAAAEDALAHAELLHAPLAQTTALQARWYEGRTAEVLDALPVLVERVTESGYRDRTALVAAQCSVAHALAGRIEAAVDYLSRAHAVAITVPDAPLVDTNLSVADAAVAVALRDEAAARAALRSHLERRPLRQGMAAAPQQRHLALFYVLVPETRPVWDAADLGPAWALGRHLARAAVAARDGRPVPPDTPALDEAALVQAHLPPPWVAELGLAATADGRADGPRLLESTWSSSRPIVAELDRSSARPRRHRQAARVSLARLPAPPSARLTVRLLGSLELLADGHPVDAPDWRRERVRALLSYLVLHGTVSRGRLGDDLWPALDPEAQARNLRVTLTYLLRVLEPDRSPRDVSYFIRQVGESIVLEAAPERRGADRPDEWLTADVWDFDLLAEQARTADRHGAPATALASGLRAVERWRDEPAEVATYEWAVASLEQRRLSFAATAIRTGELLLARGDTDRAAGLAERALAVDPWQESGHRLVVATHLTRHDHLAARRALGRYRAEMDELGLDPDEATVMVERLVDSLSTEPGAEHLTGARAR